MRPVNVASARAAARRWVEEEGDRTRGFLGAFLTGSSMWLPAEADLPLGSDVDLWVVSEERPARLGKFLYSGVILDVSHVANTHLPSAEVILGHYHLAGAFRAPNIILDPSGQLGAIQAAVARDYAKRRWVRARCEDAEANIRRHAASLDATAPPHAQVTSWLFATGVMTHVLLVAGLRNPTVRRRYAAARDLLEKHGRLDYYETLLAMLGCKTMSAPRVEEHLAALADVFDTAKLRIRSSFPFGGDISDAARPVVVDGSRDLIARGLHREAIFWIVASYARCMNVLTKDAPDELPRFTHGFDELLRDLGIELPADLAERMRRVIEALPQLRQVADEIMAANAEIDDETAPPA